MKVKKASFIKSAVSPADLLRDDRPQVAFAGRSNVGKSSLLNRLLGRRGLAKISSKPGRTRSINYFLINDRFYFVDLPGYGYAKAGRGERESWARVVDRYLRSPQAQRQVVLLVDAKIGGSPLDAQAAEYFAELGIAPLAVATKIDRVPRNNRTRRLAEIAELLHLAPDDPVVPVSAVTGEGIQDLWSALTID